MMAYLLTQYVGNRTEEVAVTIDQDVAMEWASSSALGAAWDRLEIVDAWSVKALIDRRRLSALRGEA